LTITFADQLAFARVGASQLSRQMALRDAKQDAAENAALVSIAVFCDPAATVVVNIEPSRPSATSVTSSAGMLAQIHSWMGHAVDARQRATVLRAELVLLVKFGDEFASNS